MHSFSIFGASFIFRKAAPYVLTVISFEFVRVKFSVADTVADFAVAILISFK